MGAAVASSAASSIASLTEYFAMSSPAPPKKKVEVSLNCCSDCGEHEHERQERERREHSGK